MENLQNLEISKCFESPTNPRGTVFEKTAFAELVASIKQSGLLTPVLARQKGAKYEIIAGNRRLRAAKEAGLLFIPAKVVEMSDSEAREAQIVENLQRTDISPIDEAIAYQNLMAPATNKQAPTVEEVAVKVGKSESYIRQRMALLNLDKIYIEKVRAGILPVAHAQLVARLEKVDQPAAYAIAVSEFGPTVMVRPIVDLRKHVQDEIFKGAMKTPPWANDEAAKAEIARVTGIKGGGKTLFGDKVADSFDDPAQYALALAAHMKITADKYEADGKPLSFVTLDYSKSGKGKKVISRSRYSLISSTKGCKSAHDALVVEGREAGKIVRICIDKKCKTHHPTLLGAVSQEDTAAQKQKREEAEKKEAQQKAKEDAAFRKKLEKLTYPMSDKALDALFEHFLDRNGYEARSIAEMYDLAPKITMNGKYESRNYEPALRAHFGKSKTGKSQFIYAVCIKQAWGPRQKRLEKAL